jgi:hypothetical protein
MRIGGLFVRINSEKLQFALINEIATRNNFSRVWVLELLYMHSGFNFKMIYRTRRSPETRRINAGFIREGQNSILIY